MGRPRRAVTPSAHGPLAGDRFTLRERPLALGRRFALHGADDAPLAEVRGGGVLRGGPLRLSLLDRAGADGGQEVLRIEREGPRLGRPRYLVRAGAPAGEVLGTLRRDEHVSWLHEAWTVLGPDGKRVGRLREPSWWRPYLQRVLGVWPPLELTLHGPDGSALAVLRRTWRLRATWRIACTPDPGGRLDRRLAVALAVVMESWRGYNEGAH